MLFQSILYCTRFARKKCDKFIPWAPPCCACCACCACASRGFVSRGFEETPEASSGWLVPHVEKGEVMVPDLQQGWQMVGQNMSKSNGWSRSLKNVLMVTFWQTAPMSCAFGWKRKGKVFNNAHTESLVRSAFLSLAISFFSLSLSSRNNGPMDVWWSSKHCRVKKKHMFIVPLPLHEPQTTHKTLCIWTQRHLYHEVCKLKC